jgi:hypothetical protein
MKRASFIVAASAVASASASLIACNAVLGIERATLEEAAVEAGTDSGIDAPAIADLFNCDNYCTVITQNCQNKNQEYLSKPVCLAMCKLIPTGAYYSPTDTPKNEDTLGCRLWHANSAASDPEYHCRHAGPLGAVACGGPCSGFCNLDYRYCTDNHNIVVYGTDCEGACGGDGGIPYDEDSGDIFYPDLTQIETGNTLNCRLWHLETAIDTNDPMTHCGHTGLVSARCR